MLLNDYQAIADRIDSGVGDDARERALTVFHAASSENGFVSGWVTFAVEMPWRVGRALPQISVRCFTSGLDCPVFVTEPRFKPPAAAEREAHGVLAFQMSWAARLIAAGGWDTYIASYDSSASPHRNVAHPPLTAEASGYVIVETLRHPGDLPACRGAVSLP